MDRLSSKQIVVAFGEAKSIGDWLSDERCAITTLQMLRYRLGVGMDLREAIETPRLKVRVATVDAGVRCGKLVSTGERRRNRQATEVLCNCDCGSQIWRDVRLFSRSKFMTCGCSRVRPGSRKKKLARARDWQKNHREERRAYARVWKEQNPDLVAKHNLYRRRSGADNPERVAVREIYRQARSAAPCVCHLCGRITLTSGERHVDHREAVCRNGEHHAVNLAIACKDCNLRKHAKTELQFLLQEHQVEEPCLV